jgi:hypothetical protein
MRATGRIAFILFTLGIMGASALIAPFGVGIAQAQTSTPTPTLTAHTLVLTGDDLKRVTTPYIFVDTWGIGIDNGCGVPTWYPGSSGVSPPGWTNSPSGCRSGNNFGPGDNIPVATVRFDFLPPPWMSDIVVETWEQPITTDSYHPAVGGYALTTTGAIDEGNNHYYPVHTTVSGVTNQFDGLFYGAGQIVVYEMHVSYNDPGDHNCDNGSCLTAPPPNGDNTTKNNDSVSSVGSCATCTYSPVGDIGTDAPKLIEYLACFLKNLYFCWLNQTLALIFRYILYIVLLLQSLIIWGISQANALLIWGESLILSSVFFVAGIIQNSANQIIEAQSASTRITVTSGSSNFFDVLISLVNALGGAIHDLTTGLSSIIGSLSSTLSVLIVQLGNIIIATINDTFGVIIALINAILIIAVALIEVIGAIILALIQLITVIVQTIGAVVLGLLDGIMSGFNAPITDPIAQLSATSGSGITGACSGVMVHLCIGEYILDNTIFSSDSPITASFFVIGGLIWLDRIMWALNKFKAIAK